MRTIALQLLYLVAAIFCLYFLVLGITLIAVPYSPSAGDLDTASASSSIYMTEPKYVVLNRSSLAVNRPRLVLVGASNVVVGFKHAEVAARLPRVEVDNLAVGGSNVSQVGEIVDLVQQMQSPDARHDTTFVIGLWYGLFISDRAKWYSAERVAGDTDIDIELYRYGFFRRSDHGPIALLPPEALSWGVVFIHPYLVLDKLSRDATRQIRDLIFGRQLSRTDAQRDAAVLSESDKLDALAYWRTQMQVDRDVPLEQFKVLEGLVGKLLASGSNVVLVDLAIPHWHATRSPFFGSYTVQKEALVAQFQGKPGFTFVEMSGQDADSDFSDEVHPKPRVTAKWATFLTEHLDVSALTTNEPDTGAH
jgi:hypothetical protein